jgi:hypothetical protein
MSEDAARQGAQSAAAPSPFPPIADIVNPPGWFIHELAATTIRAPRSPVIGIGTPVQKWAQGLRRLQPSR